MASSFIIDCGQPEGRSEDGSQMMSAAVTYQRELVPIGEAVVSTADIKGEGTERR